VTISSSNTFTTYAPLTVGYHKMGDGGAITFSQGTEHVSVCVIHHMDEVLDAIRLVFAEADTVEPDDNGFTIATTELFERKVEVA
jgi:hypothetical protein